MTAETYCFWCERRKGTKVKATQDGGRFGPLCDDCARVIQSVMAELRAVL
jgi:hypothetical protein